MLNEKALTTLLSSAIALSLFWFIPSVLGFRLPGVDKGYAPEQPIAFSHRLHAGEMEIPCLYCHSGADKSRHAGIPALRVCMNCHDGVLAPIAAVKAEDAAAEKENRDARQIVSPEILKIYTALGLDVSLKADPALTPAPVAWKRVHNLPDFVYFDHRPHVNAGVACGACHGPVETMDRVRQYSALTMGWCVDCHRRSRVYAPPDSSDIGSLANGIKPAHVAVDCSRCHY